MDDTITLLSAIFLYIHTYTYIDCIPIKYINHIDVSLLNEYQWLDHHGDFQRHQHNITSIMVSMGRPRISYNHSSLCRLSVELCFGFNYWQ